MEEMSEVLETTETGAEAQEVTEPAETQGEGAEVQEPAEPVKEDGKTEQDAAFAQLRREKEESEKRASEAEKRAKEAEEKLEREKALLSRASDSDDPALELVAQQLGVEPGDLMEALEAEQEDERLNAERDVLRREVEDLRIQAEMEKDLREVQKINPKIKDLSELGESFMKCISAGMSADEAYHASQYLKEKTSSTPPAEIGKINQSETEKDFFTKEEVEAMSEDEIKKNLRKIEKSQAKW